MPSMNVNNHFSSSSDSAVGTVVSIGVVVGVIYLAFQAVVALAVPAVAAAFAAFTGVNLAACVSFAAEGAVGSALLGFAWRRFVRHEEDVFRSAAGVSSLIADALIGFCCGWLAAAGGANSIFQLVMNRGIIIPRNSAIAMIISGGSGGGVGDAPAVLVFIFIIIMYIVQALIAGALAGLTAGTFSGILYVMLKRSAIRFIFTLTERNETETVSGRIIAGSLVRGLLEGLFIGVFNGIAQGLLTAILAVQIR